MGISANKNTASKLTVCFVLKPISLLPFWALWLLHNIVLLESWHFYLPIRRKNKPEEKLFPQDIKLLFNIQTFVKSIPSPFPPTHMEPGYRYWQTHTAWYCTLDVSIKYPGKQKVAICLCLPQICYRTQAYNMHPCQAYR